MARDNPLSFLHVVKPEIDMDPDVDLYSDQVYEKGAQNLARIEREGHMFRDEKPCLYLYRQTMRIGDRDHVQVGVVAGVSVEEYENNLIKKHEMTRPDKEKDRTRHVETLNANTGPVFLTYASEPKIDALVEESCKAEPAYDFIADDGIGHTFWVIEDDDKIEALVSAFAALPHM
jgi:uncharacterized protein (DUF1015 family)